MALLRTRIARLEQRAPGSDVAEPEWTAEEIEESNRLMLERMRSYVADRSFDQLPAEAQLAELLANPPSPPDPAALGSGDLGTQLDASIRAAGLRFWETRVRLLRDQIASGAAPAQRGTGPEA